MSIVFSVEHPNKQTGCGFHKFSRPFIPEVVLNLFGHPSRVDLVILSFGSIAVGLQPTDQRCLSSCGDFSPGTEKCGKQDIEKPADYTIFNLIVYPITPA